MKRTGRPRDKDVPEYLLAKMPKKETDEHREMRAFYLSLPQAERHLRRVAEKFECSYDKVYLTARAFNWSEDGKQRDAAIQDPFLEEHQKLVKDFRIKALLIACKHLDNELLRAGVISAKLPEEIEIKAKDGDLEGATEDLLGHLKSLPMKAKDYKDLNNLVDLVRKIVYEWNPNDAPDSGGNGKGKSLQFNSYSLIIEKA
jgi:hypothetical protein